MLLDTSTGRCMLFVPDRPLDYAVWNGEILSQQEIEQQYGIDQVSIPCPAIASGQVNRSMLIKRLSWMDVLHLNNCFLRVAV